MNRPDDAGDLEAGRQDEQHEGRVDAHGPAVERRADPVAEDHVADGDQREQRDDGDVADGRPRHEQDDRGRHDPAEVRDVAAQEHEDRQGHRARHAEQQHEHEVRARDDRGQDRGAPEIAREAGQRVLARGRDPRSASSPRPPGTPTATPGRHRAGRRTRGTSTGRSPSRCPPRCRPARHRTIRRRRRGSCGRWRTGRGRPVRPPAGGRARRGPPGASPWRPRPSRRAA